MKEVMPPLLCNGKLPFIDYTVCTCTYIHTYIHTYIYIYIYTHIYICPYRLE